MIINWFSYLLLEKMSIFSSRVLDHQDLLCCQDLLFLGALSSGTMHRKEQSTIVSSKNTPLESWSRLKIGPAYKATPRQGDKATIWEVVLILLSRYIFIKRQHFLRIPLRQVKISKWRHSVKNGVKFNKKRHCLFLNQ